MTQKSSPKGTTRKIRYIVGDPETKTNKNYVKLTMGKHTPVPDDDDLNVHERIRKIQKSQNQAVLSKTA